MKFTSRRGLSSIVTMAIMLTSVAMLGTGIVIWSNSNLKTYEKSLVTNSANMTNQINENLVIENIAFCKNCGSANSANVINVTLTNTGTLGLQVDKIQINSTAISSFFSSNSLPAKILPKQSYLVSATLPSPKQWASQKPDTITITTHRGTIITTQAVPS